MKAGKKHSITGKESGSQYRLLYDIHTHTIYSDGKSTIEDNVKAAVSKGLKTIGISDHGPGHIYGVRHKKLFLMRAEIERLKPLYPDIEILLGVEANIINMSGRLNVNAKELEQLDYLLAGYHYGVLGENPALTVSIHIRNIVVSRLFHRSTKAQIKRNTEMTVRAIYENKIKILTHPGDKGAFDVREIALACADRGTLMEISTWHNWLSVEGIRQAAKTDVRFVIGSDAHTPERIGDCLGAVIRIRKAGLDFERVENLIVGGE